MAVDNQKRLCPICRQPFNPYPMGNKDGYDFVACRACGSAMVDPPVTQEEQDRFYVEAEPQATHVPDPAGQIAYFRKQIQHIMPGDLQGKRLLDVACRQGYGVQAARDVGMQAQGIDTHEFLVRFAQEKYGQARFALMNPREYADSQPPADLVFCAAGFSETTDPDALAASLSRCVAPGGIAYIEEADGNSMNTPRQFARWPFAAPPINMFYPSKKGMQQLLARHGLRVEKIFFNWRPMMRIVARKQ